jgi:chromosomal replication initiator protein
MSHRVTTNGRTPGSRQNVAGLEELLGCLRATRPELVRSWFQHLRLTSLTGGLVEVSARSAAQVSYLEAYCLPAFTEAAQAVTGRLVSVAFKAPEADEAASGVIGPDSLAALDPAFTLDRFVTGPGNQLAHSTAAVVAERPGEAYNPFYVYGAAGLGKTHLLQGVVHAAAGRYGDGQCLYVSCRTFVSDAIRAMEDGRGGELRERYGTVALLALDDVHLLAGRERSEEEFFHILNLLLASQRQVVLAADRLPSEVPGLQERLVSRLSAGLVVALDAPCLETRMAIVRDKANLLAIDLPAEVIRLVVERYESDVRWLAEALVRIDALSKFESGPITVELAKRALKPGRPALTGKVG